MATLDVAFRPRAFDRILAGLLLVVGVAQIAIGIATLLAPPRFSVSCDRAAQTCRVSSSGLFGGGTTQSLAMVALRGSRVEPAPKGGQRWVLTAGDHDAILGNATTDAGRIAEYTRLAAGLEAFLQDPSKPTFAAEYTGLGGPPSWVFLIVGAILTVLALRWIRGWRADLAFDRDAGTLTIRERPTLGLGAGTRTVPLASIARVEALGGDILVAGGVVRTLTLRLVGPEGQAVFRRRVVLDNSSRPELAGKYKAMKELIGG